VRADVRARRCQRADRAFWRVTVREGNYSAFNGGRFTPSAYSEVKCAECGRVWRTKAAYVQTLRDWN
jgi:hypothetical protein